MTGWWSELALLLPAAFPNIAIWLLVLIFGIKAYRSCKLESLPWLGIYIVASAGVGVLWIGTGLGHSTSMEGGSTMALQYLGWFLSGSARLVVAILLLSDLQFVLSQAGIPVEGRFLNKLAKVRERSTTWGIVMLAPVLLKAALGMSLYL